MIFTFKRDEEGRERIYVGDVCVWLSAGDSRNHAGCGGQHVTGVTADHIADAIERADEAGFWAPEPSREAQKWGYRFKHDEVFVDVPAGSTT